MRVTSDLRSRCSMVGRAGGLLAERLGRGLAALLAVRHARHVVCPNCAVDFAPRHTDGPCPICGWMAEDAPRQRRRRRDTQLTAVGATWVLGIVVFLVLAHALYT